MPNLSDFPTLLTFNGFEACILVDGKEVPHYGIECNEEKRVTTCWIESQAGKPFAYQYKRIKAGYDCSASVYLDGKWAGTIIIRKERVANYVVNEHSVRISPTEVQNLIFGSLELTDDDAYLETSSSLQNLGEIKLIFHQVQNVRATERSPEFAKLFETQKIHERSKKALSHQVSFGEPVRMEERAKGHIAVDYGGKLATFLFKYRPLAMLQANGIAPLDPIILTQQEERLADMSSSLGKKRKHSEMKPEIDEDYHGEEDVTERALLAELEKVKRRELARSGGSNSKQVKQRSQTYFAPEEIIDLT